MKIKNSILFSLKIVFVIIVFLIVSWAFGMAFSYAAINLITIFDPSAIFSSSNIILWSEIGYVVGCALACRVITQVCESIFMKSLKDCHRSLIILGVVSSILYAARTIIVMLFMYLETVSFAICIGPIMLFASAYWKNEENKKAAQINANTKQEPKGE